MTQARAAIAVAMALITLSACGDDSESGGAPDVESSVPQAVEPDVESQATTEETSTSTSTTEVLQETWVVEFVDGDGWTYDIRFPAPGGVELIKNISSSPPGKAKLEARLIEPYAVGELEAGPTNPGRPGGPRRGPSVWYVFPGPEINGGPCFGSATFLGPPKHGISGTLCRAWDSSAGGVGPDVDESVIDGLVGMARSGPQVLVAMGDWGMGEEEMCAVSALVMPSGEVTIEGDDEAATLGCSLSLRIE